MACCGDVPTMETLRRRRSLARATFPTCGIRFVNVVDLLPLQSPSEHPHGLSDRDFDAMFTADKPIIFAFHGYPWLIHRLTYRRTNHDNLHVRGYKEEGHHHDAVRHDGPQRARPATISPSMCSIASDALPMRPRTSISGCATRSIEHAATSSSTATTSRRFATGVGRRAARERRVLCVNLGSRTAKLTLLAVDDGARLANRCRRSRRRGCNRGSPIRRRRRARRRRADVVAYRVVRISGIPASDAVLFDAATQPRSATPRSSPRSTSVRSWPRAPRWPLDPARRPRRRLRLGVSSHDRRSCGRYGLPYDDFAPAGAKSAFTDSATPMRRRASPCCSAIRRRAASW